MNILIVKKDNIDDNELSDFFNLLKENNILIVEDVKNADLIVSFGGDGTILSLVPLLKEKNIPVFSINYGNLGYITKINKKNYIKSFKEYLNNNYSIDHRDFLEISFEYKIYYALNEVSILKSSINNSMIYIYAYEEDKLINKYRADGLIISSPTGSTAYSLSAGGPIIYPNLKVICITPLAPQSLSARSLILDANKKYFFETETNLDYCMLNIDGNKHIKVYNNQSLKITLSKKGIDLIYIEEINYYEVLKNKLHWN